MIPVKQITIFIVEDNKIFALALKADIETFFANKPLKIYTFETGEACMEKFREEKPQIVILDYALDSKHQNAADGIKILDWIKKENKETYVIMLTGDDRIDIALNSFKHGATDYIVKTDTQFRKITFSLFNCFKIMKEKSDAKKYMNLVLIACLGFALLVGGVIAFLIMK